MKLLPGQINPLSSFCGESKQHIKCPYKSSSKEMYFPNWSELESLFLKIFIYLFIYLERGEGREKERERNISVQEKHQLAASCMCTDQGAGPNPDQ